MTTITIGCPTIAGKPAWLTQNQVRRLHHQAHAQAARAWRHTAAWRARADRLAPVASPVVVVCEIARTSPRRLDADAIAPTCKAVIDGLVDAGVLAGDGPEHVAAVTYVAESGRAALDALTLTLTPARERAS